MILRDYQNQAIEEIFDNFHKGNKRVIYYGATGSGKSETAAFLARDCLNNNFPCVMIVRGRELVKNLSKRLDKYKINHAVNMAGHHRYDPSKLVQICSIDTLNARTTYPYSDSDCLVILDEQHKNYDSIYENYPNAYFVGLSGTPFSDQNKYYDAVVCPIMPFELRDQKILVPELVYVPHMVDTSSVKMVAGDFKRDQLESLMSESAIIGNIVNDYIKYGQDRPAICFAVSVEHSKRLRDAFLDAKISAVHCDANSSETERDNAKIGLEIGKIKVVVNVDIFSVGFDCPIVSCIIQARPTWSLIWYLQAIGRGLRSFKNKDNCIILDNAGNIFRHGSPYKIREVSLEVEEKKKKKKSFEEGIRNCINCFIVIPYSDLRCSHCGAIQEFKQRKVKEVDGELALYRETDDEKKERQIRECRIHFGKLEWVRKQKNFHANWTFNNLEKKFPKDIIATLNSVTRVPDKYLPVRENSSLTYAKNLQMV